MVRIIGTGTSGGGNFNLDSFAPILGQTLFALTAVPSVPTEVLVYVNGVLYRIGVDYTVLGTALTWLNVLFGLGPPDVLEVYYEA